MVSGYSTVSGTDIRSSLSRGYTVRPAPEVLEEGLFNIQTFTAGHGGRLDVVTPTTVLDGTIRAEAIEGYEGGLLSLSGAETAIVRSATSLPLGFGFGDDLPIDVQGKLVVNSAYLTGTGLKTLDIGSLGITHTAGQFHFGG